MGDAEEESALGLTDEVIEMELARAEDAELCEAGATAVGSALHDAGVRDELFEPESLSLDSGGQASHRLIVVVNERAAARPQ